MSQLEAKFVRGDQDPYHHTLSAAASPGEVIELDATNDFAGVVLGLNDDALGNGALAAVATKGIWDFKAASALTFAIGEYVFWDVTGNTVIKDSVAAADLFLGPVVEKAKVAGELWVRVDLNRDRQPTTGSDS